MHGGWRGRSMRTIPSAAATTARNIEARPSEPLLTQLVSAAANSPSCAHSTCHAVPDAALRCALLRPPLQQRILHHFPKQHAVGAEPDLGDALHGARGSVACRRRIGPAWCKLIVCAASQPGRPPPPGDGATPWRATLAFTPASLVSTIDSIRSVPLPPSSPVW